MSVTKVIEVDPGYRIKKPKYYNTCHLMIASIFVLSLKDLTNKKRSIRQKAIRFFSSDICDEFAHEIGRTGAQFYEIAKKVYHGDIDLSDYGMNGVQKVNT